jgi:hypothetical protein
VRPDAGEDEGCSLCRERLRRQVNMIDRVQVDLRPLVARRFGLDRIKQARELFANGGMEC